ncbi:hypothetical protein [Streptomyces sp. NPDC088350]|uniref:hypothetical protein n=1 Tax=Streptomyces sp. NPDC088350 TaxID=3365854 RepID=UPI0037F209C2
MFNQAVADRLGLHPTDLQCLNLLTLEAGPVTTGRIAELTGLTTGSATRLVDRLGGGWFALFDDLDDSQLAVIVDHMRRTREFSARQTARLRAGDVDG